MYIDMTQYNIEDLKSKEDKAYIAGYKAALKDLQSALENYRDCQTDGIEIFAKLRAEIAEDFTDYATDYMSDCVDNYLVSALDEQALEEDAKDE